LERKKVFFSAKYFSLSKKRGGRSLFYIFFIRIYKKLCEKALKTFFGKNFAKDALQKKFDAAR
jgi:hypothetical protein